MSKKSVRFCKSEATKHPTQYQRLIRRLIESSMDANDKPPNRTQLGPPASGCPVGYTYKGKRLPFLTLSSF